MTSLDSSGEEMARKPSLRDQQRAVTRDRIVTALGELVASQHPLDVTMAAVAKQAGVSEPTLYRYFPTKRDLFRALGSNLYRRTTDGVVLSNVDELIEFLPSLYAQFTEMEATTRWNLAAPKDEAVRPAGAERLPILRGALGPTLESLDELESDALLRAMLLFTSPIPLLYWQDYLGITADEAARSAGWLIRRLVEP